MLTNSWIVDYKLLLNSSDTSCIDPKHVLQA